MGEKDLVMLRIDAVFKLGEGQVQGMFAIFRVPDGLPIIGGIGDVDGRLVRILNPKGGQFRQLGGAAVVVGDLLLGN